MGKTKITKKKEKTSIWVHLFFIIFGLACIIPFLIVISASISNDTDLAIYGYSVFPKKIDLSAYKLLMKDASLILDAYKVTIFNTVTATALAMVVNSIAAYALARKSGFLSGKILTYIIYHTFHKMSTTF